MESYVDIYINPVPKSKVDAFKTFGTDMSALAKKHGALYYAQYMADDVKPGQDTSFPQAVKLGADEVVFVSWTVYKSRADRDLINKAIMADSAFGAIMAAAPIDGKRMFMGGFRSA